MNVLINYSGHFDWRHAMHALFGKRLGYTVYHPDGSKEWAKLGITQAQHNSPYFGKTYYEDDIQHALVIRDNYVLRFLSVEQFMEMDFDLVVVGNGWSERAFYKLVRKFKPNSVLIRQIANLLEKPKLCRNVLLSTKTPMPNKIHWTKHYMEPPPGFHYVPHNGEKKIKSFSNFLRKNKDNSGLWDEAKILLPEFDFKMHGAENDDKWVDITQLHQAMKDSMFIWHTKAAGGGGFACQEALACGRPMIVKKQYSISQKTRAQDYLIDGVNCIDLSKHDISVTVKKIREWSEPDVYERRCKQIVKHYEHHFNFKKEAKKIKTWIGTLTPGV